MTCAEWSNVTICSPCDSVCARTSRYSTVLFFIECWGPPPDLYDSLSFGCVGTETRLVVATRRQAAVAATTSATVSRLGFALCLLHDGHEGVLRRVGGSISGTIAGLNSMQGCSISRSRGRI